VKAFLAFLDGVIDVLIWVRKVLDQFPKNDKD